jgi:hypothetical protein
MWSHGSRRTGRKNDSRKDARLADDMVINSKDEIRNSKQIQMLKPLNSLDFSKTFPRSFRWESVRARVQRHGWRTN